MEFRGEYAWLSNFWLAPIDVKGIIFPSVENAYQAFKSPFPHDWLIMSKMTPSQAKRRGKTIPLRDNWHDIKLEVMTELVTLKFDQHPDLKAKLIATGKVEIVETNSWDDTYWGRCNGFGYNHLGQILMAIRSATQLQKSTQENYVPS